MIARGFFLVNAGIWHPPSIAHPAFGRGGFCRRSFLRRHAPAALGEGVDAVARAPALFGGMRP